MKRIKVISAGLLASILVAVGGVSIASATRSPNFRSSNGTVTVEKGATHTGSLYATGDKVTVDGTVTGSVYCAGGTITINGTVGGDVLCAGQKVTINGTVAGDVRTAGQYVQVDGIIDGSLSAFGQDVRLSKDARVGEDVNGAAQQVILAGVVGRDVAIGAQSLELNGEVKGNVDVGVEQLRLGGESSVLGNLNYSAQKELSFDKSQVVREVSYNPASKYSENSSRGVAAGMKTLFLLMLALSALVVALLLPRFLHRSSELFGRQMLMTILLGFTFVFGGPIVVAFLLISVLLAPIGLTLLFVWLAVLLLSGIFFAYWIGAELLRSQENIVIRMLGGMVIVLLVYLIPFLNILVMFVASVIGSGMIITTLTNGYRRPSYSLATTTKAKTAK